MNVSFFCKAQSAPWTACNVFHWPSYSQSLHIRGQFNWTHSEAQSRSLYLTQYEWFLQNLPFGAWKEGQIVAVKNWKWYFKERVWVNFLFWRSRRQVHWYAEAHFTFMLILLDIMLNVNRYLIDCFSRLMKPTTRLLLKLRIPGGRPAGFIQTQPGSETKDQEQGPEKPLAYSVRHVFSYVVKGIKTNNCKVSCLEKPLFWR